MPCPVTTCLSDPYTSNTSFYDQRLRVSLPTALPVSACATPRWACLLGYAAVGRLWVVVLAACCAAACCAADGFIAHSSFVASAAVTDAKAGVLYPPVSLATQALLTMAVILRTGVPIVQIFQSTDTHCHFSSQFCCYISQMSSKGCDSVLP